MGGEKKWKKNRKENKFDIRENVNWNSQLKMWRINFNWFERGKKKYLKVNKI